MLTPSTSVLTVLVVGMVAGHMLMPARTGLRSQQGAAFLLAMIAAGALGGWRTSRAFGWRRTAIASVAGAAVALGLAAAAYAFVHG